MRTAIRGLSAILTLLLAGLASTPMQAADDPDAAAPAQVVFSAAGKGAGYWNLAERFRSVSAESGIKVRVLESVGSVENLERLADPDSPVVLALSQADALRWFLDEHPELADELVILESIGRECVFIIADANGDLTAFADLQGAKGHRIAIPGERSGVAVSFDYMTKRVPGLANTRPVYTDTVKAMKQMHAGAEDAVDAVMLVQRPLLNKAEMRFAVGKRSGFRMIPIDDPRLLAPLPNGEDVYELLDVPLDAGHLFSADSVTTVCTRGLLLMAPGKLGEETAWKLRRIIDFQWPRIDRLD